MAVKKPSRIINRKYRGSNDKCKEFLGKLVERSVLRIATDRFKEGPTTFKYKLTLSSPENFVLTYFVGSDGFFEEQKDHLDLDSACRFFFSYFQKNDYRIEGTSDVTSE